MTTYRMLATSAVALLMPAASSRSRWS